MSVLSEAIGKLEAALEIMIARNLGVDLFFDHLGLRIDCAATLLKEYEAHKIRLDEFKELGGRLNKMADVSKEHALKKYEQMSDKAD